MSVKKVITLKRIMCPFHIENGCKLEHCDDCTFFNGYEKDSADEITGVDCLYSDMPKFHCHVTSFIMGDSIYEAHIYNPEIDGPVEDDNVCSKCCFCKVLQNGREACVLRCSVDDADIDSFCCYENEIWTKRPNNYNN